MRCARAMATGGIPERKTMSGFCSATAETVSSMRRTGDGGGLESGLIEDLGEHGGDEVVGAVADGDDYDAGGGSVVSGVRGVRCVLGLFIFFF